ncbi:helix-turn-helix transcriptional regulator [uncultured Tateyamaria sp.]|uniref:helix-turn-helix domain-containing protein n=1 Tax=uncultured Tateyamaria sp. TaxID=455651 RepID=UPI00262324B9|nr:helix-turn-helix transcriptional regulator [uncultured Tateyamaria sp.]
MSNPVDIKVGKRVRQRRSLLGMSQEALAGEIGTKFQQVQKYEVGANRISASRLWDISNALDVPVSYFFETVHKAHGSKPITGIPTDILSDKEALDLVRTYYGIPEAHRKMLFDLAKALAL